ncbi:MAG TPA: nucleotidyltransferase family protein [Candidatus Contendobacter sp.]|nr:nucleotidyltransferase family protein [Candidatus Contendobacter sp.]
MPPTRSSYSAVWLDLAALLDPAGVFSDRVTPPDRDWLALFRLATAHLVAPSLYATLAARGQLHLPPPDIREALAALHTLNNQRNRRLRAVLRDTVKLLNQAGIEPLLLKGAIALLPGQYPHAFARMLGDLDLAVAEPETHRAAEVLRAAGFYPAPNIDPALWSLTDHHHLLPLFHPSGDGYIEIHQKLLADRVPKAALCLTMVQARARLMDWDGLRVRIPALEHRLLHNALHHQLQDGAFFFGLLSLRQLLEFAQLRALPDAVNLDWPRLFQHLDAVGAGDALRGYLLAAQRLFDQPLPDGVSLTRTALRAEGRCWFRLRHPRLGRGLEWLARLPRRLPNLPKRLLTPAWYPAKYRYLRQQWFPKRRGFDEGFHD